MKCSHSNWCGYKTAVQLFTFCIIMFGAIKRPCSYEAQAASFFISSSSSALFLVDAADKETITIN